MISSAQIDQLILNIDEHIKKYSDSFSKKKKMFDDLTANCAFIANERTVSGVATIYLAKELKDLGYKASLIVNEFPIEVTNKLSSTNFDAIRSLTSPKTRTNQWNKCYVDGYIQVADLIKSGNVVQLFIEYKMENCFSFLNLATDYLKYKTYTFKSNEDTVFVYAIFDKTENYPSLIGGSTPLFELIGDDISSIKITGEKKVYIYANQQTNNAKKKSNNDIEQTFEKFNRLSLLSENLLNTVDFSSSDISKEQQALVNGMRFFNSRVLKSNTLKAHFPFMKRVWDAANEMELFADLPEIFGIPKSDISIETIIREGSNYKQNLSSIITAKSKETALEHGVRGSTNTSLFIVSICDYFNERFELGVEPPDYKTKTIRSGKNTIKHEWQKTVDYFKNELANRFKNNSHANNRLKKLYYSLMFYIVELFQVIYKISDDDEILDYSDSFAHFKEIEYLQNEINKLTKEYSFKGNIDIEDLLYKRESESKNNLLDFVKWILTIY